MAKESAKFAWRYEEGYDLNDSCYEAWLAIEHQNGESMHDHQLLSNDRKITTI